MALTVWLLVGERLARRTHTAEVRSEVLTGQVVTDPLTGLPNRRALSSLLAAAGAGDGLVLLDLDHFRVVNEGRGHTGGDRVLADFGDAVRATLRSQDRAVRYGGEEILLLLIGDGEAGAHASSLDATLTRLRTAWHRLQPDVTFSAGGVVVGLGQDGASALRAADHLLYAAKDAGRDRWLLSPAPQGDSAGEASSDAASRRVIPRPAGPAAADSARAVTSGRSPAVPAAGRSGASAGRRPPAAG